MALTSVNSKAGSVNKNSRSPHRNLQGYCNCLAVLQNPCLLPVLVTEAMPYELPTVKKKKISIPAKGTQIHLRKLIRSIARTVRHPWRNKPRDANSALPGLSCRLDVFEEPTADTFEEPQNSYGSPQPLRGEARKKFVVVVVVGGRAWLRRRRPLTCGARGSCKGSSRAAGRG